MILHVRLRSLFDAQARLVFTPILPALGQVAPIPHRLTPKDDMGPQVASMQYPMMTPMIAFREHSLQAIWHWRRMSQIFRNQVQWVPGHRCVHRYSVGDI